MAQQQQQQQQQQLPQANISECQKIYKLSQERAADRFRQYVWVEGEQAYKTLIHTLKAISCEYFPDLVDANEATVLQSIRNTTAVHFKTGFTVTAKASTSREVEPDFSTTGV